MAQFDVFENRDTASRKRAPYLLDVQSELLADLATRVVIPLARQSRDGLAEIERLMPAFEIDGVALTLVTPQLAGVPRAILGARVASLADRRHDIIAALDVLISGV
jgi:toxin CcdB